MTPSDVPVEGVPGGGLDDGPVVEEESDDVVTSAAEVDDQARVVALLMLDARAGSMGAVTALDRWRMADARASAALRGRPW